MARGTEGGRHGSAGRQLPASRRTRRRPQSDTEEVLDWDELDPARVERVAQMLVRDVFGATSIDGAGGGEAQDLRWDSPTGLVVFEVKSFKKRLAGSQKAQVRRSLARAVALHSPARWVLVTRSNPTPGELAWLQSLATVAPGVSLEWLGRDWLDGQIAGREDLISYVEGPDYKLLRRAAQLGHEQAAAVTGPDVAHRLGDLLALGDDISPYWRWDFTTTSGQRAAVLTAKRPESPDEDPITLSPVFSFPAGDPEADAISGQLRDVLLRGGDVTVPGRYVASFRVTAASSATQRLLGDEDQPVRALRIASEETNDGLPVLARLAVVDDESPAPDATELASTPVSFTRRQFGTEGVTLTGSDPSGTLRVEVVVVGAPDDASGRLSLTLASPAGRHAHDVLPVLRLLAAVGPGRSLRLTHGPALLGRFTGSARWPEDLRPLGRLVTALDVIGTHTGRALHVPGTAEPETVRNVLDASGALLGETVRLPYSGLDTTVRGGMLEGFVSKVPDEGGALYVAHDFPVDLAGEEIVVPGLATWAPRVQLANREDLKALAVAEPTAEHVARFEPIDGEGVYLIRAVTEPDEPWTPLSEPE